MESRRTAGQPSGGFRGLLLCCSVVLLACPWARAQAGDADRPVMYADFGWAGKIPGERWSPITVWIQGGEKAVGGVIVAEFTQDATQSARIITPFAATPGERTGVPIVAALPVAADEVRLTMFDERGSELARITYSRIPDETQATLPSVLDPGVGLFVGAGTTSLTEAASYWSSRRIGPRGPRRDYYNAVMLAEEPTDAALEAAWTDALPATIDPALLPISWMAYEGVTVLAVDSPAAAKADARAVDAVRRWVESGGRLVVLATDPGPQWRNWLPDGAAGDLVEVGAPERGPLPDECLEAIKAETGRDRVPDRLENEEEPSGVAPPPPAPVVAPAASAPYRPIVLTARGEAEGWRVRWRTDRGAALAEGPVGFGWVVVLGLDPRSAPSVLSGRTSSAVWRDALAAPVRGWLSGAASAGERFYGGATSEPEQAIGAALERLSGGPSPGGGLFLAIAGCMLALAALVGPLDYLILKRLGQAQRSWLTALTWIGLASLGAYAAPRLVRDAPTQVARLTAIDRLVPRPGSQEEAAPPTAWQTGLTGVFSGESGRLRFTEPDESAWWRGVAVYSLMAGQRFVLANVTTRQAAAGGAEGTTRGNPVESIGLTLWTFRAFVDQSRITSGVSARVDRDGEAWRVRVTGLPDGVRIRRALLRVGGDQATPSTTEPVVVSGGAWEWTVPRMTAADDALRTWHRVGWNEAVFGGGVPSAFDRPGLGASLPGACSRSLAIDERVATGRYAAVHLLVAGWPTDTPVDASVHAPRLGVLRLVVPLDEVDRVAATDVAMLPRLASNDGVQRQGVTVRPVPPRTPPPIPPPGPMGPEAPGAEPPKGNDPPATDPPEPTAPEGPRP